MSTAIVTNISEAEMPIQQRATGRQIFLMCAPTLYDVDYVINPWMAGNVHASSRERATAQWQTLYEAIARIADVQLITPEPGSPDMVFTANAGLEHHGTVMLSSFFHAERQGEEQHFRRWFEAAGYRVFSLPSDTPFEGEGDALFSRDGKTLWVGFGPRTLLSSHNRLGQIWPVDVVSLHLVDPRFYHLDTCFAVLEGDCVLYYPAAFDDASRAKIEAHYPADKRVIVTEEDAVRFACNAINIGATIILNHVSDHLAQQLRQRGFNLVQLELSEFLKAGGAAKCLVMKLSRKPSRQVSG